MILSRVGRTSQDRSVTAVLHVMVPSQQGVALEGLPATCGFGNIEAQDIDLGSKLTFFLFSSRILLESLPP